MATGKLRVGGRFAVPLFLLFRVVAKNHHTGAAQALSSAQLVLHYPHPNKKHVRAHSARALLSAQQTVLLQALSSASIPAAANCQDQVGVRLVRSVIGLPASCSLAPSLWISLCLHRWQISQTRPPTGMPRSQTRRVSKKQRPGGTHHRIKSTKEEGQR